MIRKGMNGQRISVKYIVCIVLQETNEHLHDSAGVLP